MKFTRFLTLTVALAPMVTMAGPLDELLGAAINEMAKSGGGNSASAPTARNKAGESLFFKAGNTCSGGQQERANSWAIRLLNNINSTKTPTIESFCSELRASTNKADAQCYASCESQYREYFEQVKEARKEAESKKIAAQQEEERKSAAEEEKQKAAIAASGVSVEKAASMAGEMYQAYRYGGISEMLSMENACWGALAKQKKPSDASAASCSVAALAGAFVEATYARQQRRGSAPAYNGDMFRQRLIGNMEKAGIKEDRAQRVLELSTAHQGSVLLGLMNAGMR